MAAWHSSSPCTSLGALRSLSSREWPTIVMWPFANPCTTPSLWAGKDAMRCDAMIAASCAGGFLHSFGQFLLAVFLPYCGPNEIDHYFCDVYPLLRLACADTRNIGFLVIANSGLMGLVTFVVLLISYAVIIYTVRSYSAENRRKALSTCSSHVTVVVLFFAPLLFIYIQPATTLPENKIFVLFYTIIAPMLNPLIYTLRNKEMKNAIKRLCHHITENEGNRLKS